MHKQLNELFTCEICSNQLNEPKILPCNHAFCLKPCLISLIDYRNKNIKCPKCLKSHIMPRNGIESYPDYRKWSNHTKTASSIEEKRDVCYECHQNKDNLLKCLDCYEYYCSDCNKLHLNEVKEVFKKQYYDFKRSASKYKEKQEVFDKKISKIKGNYEQIKKEVKHITASLIDELRMREQTLNNQIDHHLISEIEMIQKEKEKIENLQLFCEKTESILNAIPHTNETELFEMKKKMSNLNHQLQYDSEINNFVETDEYRFDGSNLKIIFDLIQNFGQLKNGKKYKSDQMITIRNQDGFSSSFISSYDKNGNKDAMETPLLHNKHVSVRNVPFSERLSRANSREITFMSYQSLPNPQKQGQSSRQIFQEAADPNYHTNYFGSTNMDNSRMPKVRQAIRVSDLDQMRQLNNDTGLQHPYHTSTSSVQLTKSKNKILLDGSSLAYHKKALIRSDTFELDNPTNEWTPNIDNSPRIHKKRSVKTPVSFQIIFKDDNSNYIEKSIKDQQSVLPNIENTSKPKPLIRGKDGKGRENDELICPIGISINKVTKNIYVTDLSNHCIQIFDESGKFLKTFGTNGTADGEFDCPTDITFDSMASKIFVVDSRNHRIQVFDRYYRFLKRIGGGPGSAIGQLSFPWGISVTKFSEIFVTDKENDRICVFHVSGKFLRSFGTHGSKPGQFNKPYYIHATNDNRVFVSDLFNHRIQVLDSSGVCLTCFGTEGSQIGQFKNPRGIKIDDENFIWVADSGNSRIQIFQPDGKCVKSFGANGSDLGHFDSIEGIFLTVDGSLLICDKENHQIQKL